jgi:hypothetical protein
LPSSGGRRKLNMKTLKTDYEIIRRTEKAVLISKFNRNMEIENVWLPKSCVWIYNSRFVFAAAEWLIKKYNLPTKEE